jgi:hypothetical protein
MKSIRVCIGGYPKKTLYYLESKSVWLMLGEIKIN